MGLCRTGPADPVRTLVVESRDRTPRSELRHPSDRDRGTGAADPQPAPGVAGRRADGVWRRSSPALRPRIPDAANDLDLTFTFYLECEISAAVCPAAASRCLAAVPVTGLPGRSPESVPATAPGDLAARIRRPTLPAVPTSRAQVQ